MKKFEIGDLGIDLKYASSVKRSYKNYRGAVIT